MKILKNILGLLIVTFFTFVSCTSEYVEGYSNNPSKLQDAGVNNLLTSAQQQTGWVQGDEIARITEVLVQRTKGNGRQAEAYNRYALTETNSNTDWRFNAYGGAMKDLDIIIKKGNEGGANHYVGAAKILMAINLGYLTDLFGDIPYSEAFQEAKNLSPKYDTQESIYETIQSLCDEAIVSLNKDGIKNLNFGIFDQIYNGDTKKWIKLAYGIKARYLNHLSKLPQYDVTKVLEAIASGLTSNSDNAKIGYEDSSIKANPWAAFNSDRGDLDYVEGTYFETILKNDPRKAEYAKMNTRTPNGGFYGNYNSDLLLFTFHELKFIEAEATFRKSGATKATLPLRAAIRANMTMLGIAESQISAYLGNLPTTTLELIMNEKYKALYLQPESWTDWRRTGFPKLAINPYKSNLEIETIPRRLPYPQSERLYNKNFIDLNSSQNRTQRVWWDK